MDFITSRIFYFFDGSALLKKGKKIPDGRTAITLFLREYKININIFNEHLKKTEHIWKNQKSKIKFDIFETETNVYTCNIFILHKPVADLIKDFSEDIDNKKILSKINFDKIILLKKEELSGLSMKSIKNILLGTISNMNVKIQS